MVNNKYTMHSMVMGSMKTGKGAKGTRRGRLWFKFTYSGWEASLYRCHRHRDLKMPREETQWISAGSILQVGD